MTNTAAAAAGDSSANRRSARYGVIVNRSTTVWCVAYNHLSSKQSHKALLSHEPRFTEADADVLCYGRRCMQLIHHL